MRQREKVDAVVETDAEVAAAAAADGAGAVSRRATEEEWMRNWTVKDKRRS